MQLNVKIADKQKAQIIKLALLEIFEADILEGVVFSAEGILVTDSDIPSGNFRIGELADKVLAQRNKSIFIGGLEFNLQNKTAANKKHKIQLTEIETKIISFIHTQKIASREDLLQKVWGYSAEASTRTVETHIHRLNQKIQESFGKKIIENTKNGYKLA